MKDYVFKTYISSGKEFYIVVGSNGRITDKREAMFPDSLVSLLYMDLPHLSDWLHGISAGIDLISPSSAHEYTKEISEQYDYLADDLAYFELSKFQWRERVRHVQRSERILTGTALQDDSFAALCDQLLSFQQKLQTLVPHVLDMDNSKDSSLERMVSYYRTLGAESPDVYRFSSCTTNFELIDENTFGEALLSGHDF